MYRLGLFAIVVLSLMVQQVVMPEIKRMRETDAALKSGNCEYFLAKAMEEKRMYPNRYYTRYRECIRQQRAKKS